MRKLSFLLGFLLILGLTSQASATMIENDLTGEGWLINNSSGTVEIVDSSTDLNGGIAIQDAYYGDNFAQLSGTSSISYSGSWATGETITFQWAFSAFTEAADYAYFQADGEIVRLAQASVTAGSDQDVIRNVFVGTTYGWAAKTYTFDNDYTGNLIFGISNNNTADPDSKFMVDMTAVPEPTSLLLLCSGILAIVGTRRKR